MFRLMGGGGRGLVMLTVLIVATEFILFKKIATKSKKVYSNEIFI